MKKIISLFLLMIIAVSCYDEYVLDYDYNGVFFPNPVNVRTVVVGEGLQIRVGAQIGGILKNTVNREVNFVVDNSLITPALLEEMQNHQWFWVSETASNVSTLQPIPSDYYTLSDPGKIEIKKGWHSGYVTLKVDSAKFLGNVETINPIYAIPLRITRADADTIIESLSTTVIGLRYESMFFGNYLHGGVTTVKNSDGATVETLRYNTTVNQSDQEIMKLTTVAPHSVVTNGYRRTRTNNREIMLTINGNSVTVGNAPGSSLQFEADGQSSFNGSKLLQERKLFLNYKYEQDGLTYHCQDTLSFRNRIRDGINEWQDENPDNY